MEKYSIDEIFRIIDSEEELPGKMPDAVWNKLQDRESATIVLRSVVGVTKTNLKNKFSKKEPLCYGCDYAEHDAGYCYMFKNKPDSIPCAQYKHS